MATVGTQPLRTLVIATSNLGKLEEIRALLGGQPIRVVRPADILGCRLDVVEDGATFQANAEIKARAVAVATGELTLADDSGLEVDVLGGLPGVLSARFAGEGASDSQNNAELLRRITGCAVSPLNARFCCAIAVFDPKRDRLGLVSASCEGTITRHPRGTSGFGYDPHFVVAAMGGRTMAELSIEEKNAVSHRGRALRAALPQLLEMISILDCMPVGNTRPLGDQPPAAKSKCPPI